MFNRITSNSWAENITWNTKPAIDGPQLAKLGAVAINTFYEVDVTYADISGNGTYSFAITPPTANTDTLGYASKQHATVANRPQLIITTNAGAADITPPTVTGKTPAANATGVALPVDLTVQFSEAVTGISGTSFTLTPQAGGTAIPASVTLDAAGTTATLNPTANLAANTSYTAQLTSGITNLVGNALAPVSWSFTTAAAADTTPPTVNQQDARSWRDLRGGGGQHQRAVQRGCKRREQHQLHADAASWRGGADRRCHL